MQNKRRYKRYKTDVMKMNGKVVLTKSLKILDISMDGICLKIDKRLDIGSEYTLQMKGKGKTLTVEGTGMKFVDVSKEKINEIVNFMEEHKRDIEKLVDLYGPSGRRLHVRRKDNDPCPLFIPHVKLQFA